MLENEIYSGEMIYLLANLACILLTLPVFYQSSSFVGREDENKSLRVMLWSFIIYVFTDGLFVVFTCNDGLFPIWALSVNTVVNQLSLICVSFYWLQYGLAKLEIDLTKRPGMNSLRITTYLIIFLLIITSPCTHLTYSYTSTGEYVRGPLFMLMALFNFIYNLIVPVLAVSKLKRLKSPYLRKNAMSLVYFTLVPFTFGILQVFYPNTPGLCLGFIVGFYFVYIDMLNNQIYNDSMTGLNNRRKAEQYVSDLIQETSLDSAFYFYTLDIDYFKDINDEYGHLEGDHAIRIVAKAIKKTIAQIQGFAARTGGDEFCMAIFCEHVQYPEDVVKALDKNLQEILQKKHIPYDLKMSVGFTRCDNDSIEVDELFAIADKNLYINKEEHHNHKNSL